MNFKILPVSGTFVIGSKKHRAYEKYGFTVSEQTFEFQGITRGRAIGYVVRDMTIEQLLQLVDDFDEDVIVSKERTITIYDSWVE